MRRTKTRRLKMRTRRNLTRRNLTRQKKMRGGVDSEQPRKRVLVRGRNNPDPVLPEYQAAVNAVEDLDRFLSAAEKRKSRRPDSGTFGFPEPTDDEFPGQSFIESPLSNPERIAEQKKKKGLARFKSFLRKKFTRKNKKEEEEPVKKYNPIYSSSNRSY
jgi:hypothetical protein